MKVSYKWIQNILNSQNITLDSISNTLIEIGFEVESIIDYTKKYKNVIVGQITKIHPHPNADKLQICEVVAGKNVLNIVCGAKNVKVDMMVPVATENAILPNGIKIKKTKLRGVPSEGMICSESELGISNRDSIGIMELPEWCEHGKNISEELFDNDFMIEVSIHPNRNDCNGIIGLAREIAAFLNIKTIRNPLQELSEQEKIFKNKQQNKGIELCVESTSFYGIEINNITNKSFSDREVFQRISACQIKTHNGLVDISNYVMMLTGIPIHIYDKDKINISDIKIKYATEGYQFKCIGGQIKTLHKKTIVVEDACKPISIFGIIGGEDSATTKDTKNILIECGYIPSVLAIYSALDLKVESEARYRSERGVDKSNIKNNALLALKIIENNYQGEVVSCRFSDQTDSEANKLIYSLENFEKITGTKIDLKEAKTILERLDFIVQVENSKLNIQIPPHRNDISIPEDISEELIRLRGLDSIPAQQLTYHYNKDQNSTKHKTLNDMKQFMLQKGYQEVINYSFIETELLSHFTEIQNDLMLIDSMNQLDHMETSIIPNLLKNLAHNLQHHSLDSVMLIEDANVFHSCKSSSHLLAGIKYKKEQKNKNEEKVNILSIKKDVSELLWYIFRYTPNQIDEGMQKKSDIKYSNHHNTYTVKINDKKICTFGEIHPNLLIDQFDIHEPVMFFEIYLQDLQKQADNINIVRGLKHYEREMCFIVSKETKCQEITKIAKESDKNIEQVFSKDVFENDSEFGEKRKSINISFLLKNDQSFTKTDIQKILKNIQENVKLKLDGELRGELEA